MPRKSINIEGFSHGGMPIPAASHVGPLIVTGGIHGLDPTGSEPGDAATQTARMFDNLRRILEAAGATFADVVRMTVFVKSPEVRNALNPVWIEEFPDENSRPARHTQANEQLPGPMLIQCDAIAYVEHRNG